MDSVWPFTKFDSPFIKVCSEGSFKGVVCLKIKSFTHPNIVLNLYAIIIIFIFLSKMITTIHCALSFLKKKKKKVQLRH